MVLSSAKFGLIYFYGPSGAPKFCFVIHGAIKNHIIAPRSPMRGCRCANSQIIWNISQIHMCQPQMNKTENLPYRQMGILKNSSISETFATVAFFCFLFVATYFFKAPPRITVCSVNLKILITIRKIIKIKKKTTYVELSLHSFISAPQTHITPPFWGSSPHSISLAFRCSGSAHNFSK